MKYEYHDGGRREAGYRGKARDCVCRAVAIATKQKYFTVYCALSRINEVVGRGFSARHGIITRHESFQSYMNSLGWEYVHEGPVPDVGTFIAKQHRHVFAVIDGVAYDTSDNTRGVIYGYWKLIHHE